MKKLAILGLCVVLVLSIFAASVAADITVTSTYNTGSPTFGDEDQQASNPDLDDDESDYNVYSTSTIRLSNNGTSAVTVDSISVVYNMGFDSDDLNITLENSVSVPAGGTADATMKARISEKLDAVNSNQETAAFNVADITFKAETITLTTFSAYMQRENQLEINKVEVTINNDETQSVKDDSDKIEDIKPGDHISIKIIGENNFKSSDDIDIEADNGNWEIDGDIDEDEDIDLGEISAGEEEDEDFSFTVEDDVDDDDYDFIIYLEGDDNFGAKHGHRIESEFEVKKNNHEIKIEDASITPSAISCGESFAVRVEVTNIGKKDEDAVAIRVYNEDLSIDAWKTDIELNEGDSTTKTLDIIMPSEGLEIGSKSLTVVAYYDRSEETDRDSVSINIETCGVVDDTTDDTSNDSIIDDSVVDNTAEGTGVATAQPTDNSASTAPITTVTSSSNSSGFRSSTVYVLLLILAIVVIVMAGAFLIAKMLIIK